MTERFLAHLAAGEWDAVADKLAPDYSSDDRRRVVNAGIRHGRHEEIENLRAATDIGSTDVTLGVIAPALENAATRALASAADAINRRDLDSALAHAAADACYEDRRKGLRDEGPTRPDVARALLEIAAGWLLATEPVAIRGSHLALARYTYRDTADAERPITLQHLTLMEVGDDNLGAESCSSIPTTSTARSVS